LKELRAQGYWFLSYPHSKSSVWGFDCVSELQYIVLRLIICKRNYSFYLWGEVIAWTNQTVPGNQFVLTRMEILLSSLQKTKKVITWKITWNNINLLPWLSVHLAQL
jgi:hypothetical protein